jgi:hypothetical protein
MAVALTEPQPLQTGIGIKSAHTLPRVTYTAEIEVMHLGLFVGVFVLFL